jgi:ABC-2 type transport system ATP-binding protein
MIRIDSVSYGYGKKMVLENLSLEIESGSTVMITGPNGVGKSTILRLLARVLYPRSGSIDYGWGDCADHRKRIGYLPDSLSFYRSMTPLQASRFHAGVFGCEPADLTLAERADIDLDRPITDLSVGQHVLVQFLIVLSTDPDLILIDEVLHSVDSYLRDLLFSKLIEVIEKRNPTVLMVNLNYYDIENLVQRVVFIGREGIVLDSSLDSLKESVRRAAAQGIDLTGKNLTEIMTTFMKGEYGVRRGDA